MRIAVFGLVGSILMILAGEASAKQSAMAILKRYERQYTNYKGLRLKMKVLLRTRNSSKLVCRFQTTTRPNGQRLTLLTYPGNVKGMHFLVQSKSVMYIYLPAFRKVRRLAGHVRNQGFLGTGFTYHDMAIHKWSADYRVKLIRTTRKNHLLDLREIPGRDAYYHRVRMAIRRDNNYASSIKYLNKRGKLIKTQKFGKYTCRADGSHCNPGVIQMIEHTRGNRTSTMIVQSLKYTSGYSDRMFSVRHLVRSAN